jgi:nucleoside-diphosphate-sugar epimerase
MEDIKSTVLLTGASGFLGKEINHYFRNNSNWRVKTIGRSETSDYYFDLLNSNIVIKEKFNLVVHIAGKAHTVAKTSLENQDFFDVNFKGTQNLLYGLEKFKSLPKAFIFISSVAVYGKKNGVNIPEDMPLLAKDPYGLSKIQAEQLVLSWCKKHNIICTILRLPLLIGQNPPGNLGAMIKGIQKGYYFNIAGGKAKKSMVLAEDIAKSILRVAEIGGIYNLTDGYHPSFEELSNHISIQLGKRKPMNMQFLLARAVAKFGDFLGNKVPFNTNKLNKITSNLTFDDAKAREAFGWDPKPVLEGFKLNINP